LYQKFFGFLQKTVQTAITSENYAEKNYTVGGYQIVPKNQLSIF
jgi:hypothetical protein